MPAKSKAQRRLMAMAEHGSTVPAARKLRQTMSLAQLADFASTSEKHLPKHVKKHKG